MPSPLLSPDVLRAVDRERASLPQATLTSRMLNAFLTTQDVEGVVDALARDARVADAIIYGLSREDTRTVVLALLGRSNDQTGVPS